MTTSQTSDVLQQFRTSVLRRAGGKSLAANLVNPQVSVSRKPPTPVTDGANAELERRVQQLEKEVRALRSALEELQKKPRNQ